MLWRSLPSSCTLWTRCQSCVAGHRVSMGRVNLDSIYSTIWVVYCIYYISYSNGVCWQNFGENIRWLVNKAKGFFVRICCMLCCMQIWARPTNSIFIRPKFGASQPCFELAKQILVYWVRGQGHFLLRTRRTFVDNWSKLVYEPYSLTIGRNVCNIFLQKAIHDLNLCGKIPHEVAR